MRDGIVVDVRPTTLAGAVESPVAAKDSSDKIPIFPALSTAPDYCSNMW